MDEKEYGYLTCKYILSMIFIIDTMEITDEFYEIGLLENMRVVLTILSKEESVSNKLKENMFKFLSNGRDIRDENREKRLEIINNMITVLNKSKEDEELTFYREELVKRSGDIKYRAKYDNDIIRDQMDLVDKSIGFDIAVLEALIETTSDEDFIKNYLPDLIDNAFYLNSINAIMIECPSLFQNQTFYNRNICVLNSLNEKIVENNKKLIKKVSKKIKKFK